MFVSIEFRRRTRAATKGIQPLDKTIITNWVGDKGVKRSNRSRPPPPTSSSSPRTSQKPTDDCRDYNHRQRYDRSSATTKASIHAAPQKQSNGCAKESNAQKYADTAAAAAAAPGDDMDADIVKFVDSDDESDYEYGPMQGGKRNNYNDKFNIARYLLTFDEESIHLDDLATIALDKHIEPGRAFRLFLSQVHSPFKFWFQLNEHLEMIDSLMGGLKYAVVV